MKGYRLKIIGFIICTLVLVGCGAKKSIIKSQDPTVVSEPSWHTCLIQGAWAVVVTDEDKVSASLTMQAVRDSMLVISVMPMLGMEMMRIEATPTEVIAIDKIHGRFAKASYADINRKLVPTINWDILQQIGTAQLPTGAEQARLHYAFGNKTVEVIIDYPARQMDVPVRVMNQPLKKYTEIDISRWL